MSADNVAPAYQFGFGNAFESEALPGALPRGRFSPQQPAYGLHTEKFSASAFTAPRATNRRTWFYRIQPSVVHGGFTAIESRAWCSAPIRDAVASPNPLRWDPFALPKTPCDFIDGLTTIAANGDPAAQTGIGVHVYLANRSMDTRYAYNADGELLIVPQLGALVIHTECGILFAEPGSICVIPRGMKFRVVLTDATARGYVCENYGAAFVLPERGPVGSDGLANDRDFAVPIAAYEDRAGDFELVCRFCGGLYAARLTHSPLDVVAWTGNAVPYKYELDRFNTMGTVSYDHPDPSIYTVLTSPSTTPGVANADFVIFPPRWMVAEDTFRPPWYHRNAMSEFMGLITGAYDAKQTGFVPGGSSLHNAFSAHGPELAVLARASTVVLQPERYRDTLAFMFESRYPIVPTRYALSSPQRQRDYQRCWAGIARRFNGQP